MEKNSTDASCPLPLAADPHDDCEKMHSDPVESSAIVKLTGLRFKLTFLALCVSLLMVVIEITIVNTALITIADELQSFERSSWIITAYLLTYVGFLIIASKLSDILGRKPVLLVSLALFTVWAGACGAAQTTTQLIIFRAFKGIGAAGVLSCSMIIVFEIIAPEKIPLAAAAVSSVLSIALVLGPICGGAANVTSSWRWVFLFNVPLGVVVMILFALLLPSNFPIIDRKTTSTGAPIKVSIKSVFARIDFLGAFLLLGASVLLVAALENAGLRKPWKSPLVAAMLAVSGALWVVFLMWEWLVARKDSIMEPMFPTRFLEHRVVLGLMLAVFFLGPPTVVSVFSIPQRFQVVNGDSALGAGIKLLPYTILTPGSSILNSSLVAKFKVPPLYLVLFCCVCQTVGFTLLATIPITDVVLKRQYVFQALASFGCGGNLTLTTMMTPHLVMKKDAAVAQGSITQIRNMGAVIGISIVTCCLNTYVGRDLRTILSPVQSQALLRSSSVINTFTPEVQSAVKLVFARAYNNQIMVVAGSSAAQTLAALLMWQKNQIVIGK